MNINIKSKLEKRMELNFTLDDLKMMAEREMNEQMRKRDKESNVRPVMYRTAVLAHGVPSIWQVLDSIKFKDFNWQFLENYKEVHEMGFGKYVAEKTNGFSSMDFDNLICTYGIKEARNIIDQMFGYKTKLFKEIMQDLGATSSYLSKICSNCWLPLEGEPVRDCHKVELDVEYYFEDNPSILGPTYVCKRIRFTLVHREFCLGIAHKDIYFAD